MTRRFSISVAGRDPLTIAIPALLCYVPLLFTQPGWVGADTKTYLYLDPWKLLTSAPYVWDSQIGLGTVTHQNIGYLFPMGPFFLFFDKIGVADWVAQRLWLASVIFAASMGVRYLLRTIGWGTTDCVDAPTAGRVWGPRTAATLVACLAYMFSPYLLDYAARISVILLPWAALPWLIALTAKALRHGGWKYPAWFAFVVLLVGGINATAIIMIAIGPLLWVMYAVWVEHEVTSREALGALGRMGALTVLTSLWWIAGLWAEGRYGLPVLRYTESYRAVAGTSTAPEVLRGLGYWFFYGNDKLGPWIEPSEDYTTHTALLGLSYALPILAFLAAALMRWRHRSFFIAIMVFGALAAIGSHPWKTPSILGAVFKAFTRTDTGLSLRSTPRAVPLVALGTAVFLAAAVDALGRRLPRFAIPIAALACGLVLLNMPPMWNGTMVGNNLKRLEKVPDYWTAGAQYLDAQGSETRVLEIPGAEFASYRWGTTVDPILPGLMTRPYAARELFTWGSAPSANLLIALDRRLHEEAMDDSALSSVARLMAVGDVNVRSDMQYERYRIARPRTLWQLISKAPGFEPPVMFGPPTRNIAGPQQTMIDEIELGTAPDLPDPPPLAAFPVEDAAPIVRTETANQPLLMAADGDGVVDAASFGLINTSQPIFYSAWFPGNRPGFDGIYSAGADLLVTDTNRKRARRWGALRENTGYTERATENPIEYDPSDQRLEVFPGAGDDAYTVTEQRVRDGQSIGATVTATGYGNPITYTPDDRPANALDGDPLTAWRVGAISNVQDEKLFIELDRPVTTDRINLLQPINLERTRWITKGRLTFDDDDGSAITVDLTDISRDESAIGQDIVFSSRSFRQVSFEVLESNLGPRTLFDGVSGVGFAEVRIPGVGIDELVRMPSDLLAAAGPSSIDHRLTFLFTRPRSNPAEPVRTDEEVSMRRVFTIPTARKFSIAGQARLSAYLSDDVVDRYLGLRDANQGGVTSKADVHLPGNLRQRSSAAIDGDPSTFWTSIYQKQAGHWLEYDVAKPLTISNLEMDIVADGRHSIPTMMHVNADNGPPVSFVVPPITDGASPNETVHVSIALPQPVTGSTIRFTIDEVRPVPVQEWYSNGYTVTPVSIAELGVPGLLSDKPGPQFDSGCVSNLVSIDNKAVAMRVYGSTDDALDKQMVTAEPCGPDASSGIQLEAGEHIVRTGIGRNSNVGVDIDRMILASNRGGAPLAIDQLETQVSPGPEVTVTGNGRVSTAGTMNIAEGASPFWLIMGQSWNSGWTASVNGQSLGSPTLINGYANGWLVDPKVVGSGAIDFSIEWHPQRLVWIAIAISSVAMLVCIVLMFASGRRPRRKRPYEPAAHRPDLPVFSVRSAFDKNVSQSTPVVARRTAVVTGLAFGAFAFVNLPTQWGFPLFALPIGWTLVLALRSPTKRSRPRKSIFRQSVLGLAATACFALAAGYIFVWQRRYRFNPNFVWPTLFERAHIFGVLAILLLGAEGVRDIVRRAQPSSGADSETPPPTI